MSVSVSPRPSLAPRYILLTLDAFGTLIRPRKSVIEQYLSAARDSGLKVDHISQQDLFSAFKIAFKETSRSHPNYGRGVTDMTAYKWWGAVVQKTFEPLISTHQAAGVEAQSTQMEKAGHEQVTKRLLATADMLWHRFSGPGYELFPDVGPIFEQISRLKRRITESQSPVAIVVGVVTNSDSRIPAVLRYLGLRLWSKDALSVDGTKIDAPEATQDLERIKAQECDVDFVLTSYDAGVEKPDPAIFRRAALFGEKAYRLKSTTDERRSQSEIPGDPAADVRFIHVGDDPKTDVQGALSAEWGAVLLQRAGDSDADYNWRLGKNEESDVRVVRSLEELGGMLEELIPS